MSKEKYEKVDKDKKKESVENYQKDLNAKKQIIIIPNDLDELQRKRGGHFYLVQEEIDKDKLNSDEIEEKVEEKGLKMLVPYIWQDNIGEDDEEERRLNQRVIEQQKRKYEETFNALDREAQQMSIDAAFRAGNFANNLETGVENVLEDQTKKEYAYDRLIEMTELWMEYENYRLDKLAEDAEKGL